MPFPDDFNRANENLEASANWTRTGGVAGALTVSSNQVASSGSSSNVAYKCPDQGTADHYAIAKRILVDSGEVEFLAVRLKDQNNGIGHYLAGMGAIGRRLAKYVAGVRTDLVTSQGVSGEWIKVEAEGNTIRLYEGGTGATPSWTQVGSDQTVTDLNTETGIGFLSENRTSKVLWDDFEAGALAGGGTTVTLGVSSEADTALPITAVNPRTYSIGVASETDTALSITAVNPRSYSIGIANETDFALSITPSIAVSGTTVNLGVATETGTALSITPSKTVSLGLASEASAALSITPSKSTILGIASETDTALPVTVINPRTYTIGIATETDTALPIIRIGGAETEYSETFLETVIRAKEVQLSGTIISRDSVELTTRLFYEESQTTKISDRQVQVRADLTGDTRQTTVIG